MPRRSARRSRTAGSSDPTQWLDLLDTLGEVERWVSVAFVAGAGVELDGDEANAALRRALVVRAVGGDPHRELELGEEAVTRLAEELATDGRRAQLGRALEELGALDERPALQEAVGRLGADPELAWRAYVAGLLARELAE